MKLLYPMVLQFIILCVVDLGLSRGLPPAQSRGQMDNLCTATCFKEAPKLGQFAHYDKQEGECVCRTISGDVDALNAISKDPTTFAAFKHQVEECLVQGSMHFFRKITLQYDPMTERFTCWDPTVM